MSAINASDPSSRKLSQQEAALAGDAPCLPVIVHAVWWWVWPTNIIECNNVLRPTKINDHLNVIAADPFSG